MATITCGFIRRAPPQQEKVLNYRRRQGRGQGRALTCRGLESEAPAGRGPALAIYAGSLQGQGPVAWDMVPPGRGGLGAGR